MGIKRLAKSILTLIGLILLLTPLLETSHAQTDGSTLTVNACRDQNANGLCTDSVDGSAPAEVEACLNNTTNCQPVPATFTGLASGSYTTFLQFPGSSQGYYPTTGQSVIEIGESESITVTLGAVYPIHPKGVAVHELLNKVYVAFQGPTVEGESPHPFVAVIDGSTDEVLYTIPGGENGLVDPSPRTGFSGIGREPWGVAVSGDGQSVLVGSFRDGLVSYIDPTSDIVTTNYSFGTNFQPTSPTVNPVTGYAHFPDYAQGHLLLLNTTSANPQIAAPFVENPPNAFSPFEVVTARTIGSHNFITLRDAEKPSAYKIVGLDSVAPFGLEFKDIIFPDGSTGPPHAIGLWQTNGMSEPRLFITYADDPREGIAPDFINPDKVLIYEFSTITPKNLTLLNSNIMVGDYAEVGLIFNEAANHMLGTYAGFAYDSRNGHEIACDNLSRGGTYALSFDGDYLVDGADVPGQTWRLPQTVVGNPPLTNESLQWRNPFEIAINPNNGKVYVTDRCWNEFPAGGQAGGGAVLIFTDAFTEDPTPTVTLTSTPTPELTVSPDVTGTSTVTPTNEGGTATPTGTLTPDPSETGEATSTIQPTSDVTTTPTPDLTVSPETTGTVTVTPTGTLTPIATETGIATVTVQPTSVVTTTSTPEPTVTGEATSTIQPTSSPIATLTPEITVSPETTGTSTTTPTGTLTPDPSETIVATNTVEPTSEVTVTPTSELTTSPEATITNTVTPTEEGTTTPTPRLTPGATQTGEATETPTNGESTATPTLTLTPDGAQTAEATRTPQPTVDVTATPTSGVTVIVTPEPISTSTSTPEATGTSTVTPTNGTNTTTPTGTLTLDGTQTATETSTPQPTADVTATPTGGVTVIVTPEPISTSTNTPEATSTNTVTPTDEGSIATPTGTLIPNATLTSVATGTPSSVVTVVVTYDPIPFETNTPEATPTPHPNSAVTVIVIYDPIPVPTLTPTSLSVNQVTTHLTTSVISQVILGEQLQNGSGATIIVNETHQVTNSDPSGHFTIDEVAIGLTTNITAQAPGHLSAICHDVAITGPDKIGLNPIALLSGDVNDDNLIDISDIMIITANMGQIAPNLPADLNQDGKIDILDINLVSRNFGQAGPQPWGCLGNNSTVLSTQIE